MTSAAPAGPLGGRRWRGGKQGNRCRPRSSERFRETRTSSPARPTRCRDLSRRSSCRWMTTPSSRASRGTIPTPSRTHRPAALRTLVPQFRRPPRGLEGHSPRPHAGGGSSRPDGSRVAHSPILLTPTTQGTALAGGRIRAPRPGMPASRMRSAPARPVRTGRIAPPSPSRGYRPQRRVSPAEPTRPGHPTSYQ